MAGGVGETGTLSTSGGAVCGTYAIWDGEEPRTASNKHSSAGLTLALLPMLFCAKASESMAARLDSTCPANASWISKTSMSSRVRPASSSTCHENRAANHPG